MSRVKGDDVRIDEWLEAKASNKARKVATRVEVAATVTAGRCGGTAIFRQEQPSMTRSSGRTLEVTRLK
jgi:ribosomal 50S subunit-recycling heat shock protein